MRGAGELWATYTVRLQKPRLYVSVGRQLAFDRHAGTALTVDATPVPLTIDGKQATNILGCKVSGIVHQAGADVDCNTSIEFPNYMTGVFEVVVSVFLSAGGSAYTVGNGIGFRTGSSIASLPPVQTTGSLELFPMYLETESKGVAQNWTRDNHSFAVTGSNQGLQDTMVFRSTVEVTPVVNGGSGVSDSTLTFNYFYNNGTSAAGNLDFNTAVTIKPVNNSPPWVFETPAGLKTNIPIAI